MAIELNIDLGELDHEADELYALATVVNVACGGHAGDEASMRRAIGLAERSGAVVAAHPSYVDREGFGRRSRFQGQAEIARDVRAQCEALARVGATQGVAVTILKLHGALYHDVAIDRALADAVLDAAREALPGLGFVVGPPCGELFASATARGLSFEREAFADRSYRPDGSLVPRSEPDALVIDGPACVAQAIELARSGRFETLCLHSDTPGAVDRARLVRAALEREGLLERRSRSA